MKKVLHVGCGQATLKNLPLGFQDGSWEEIRLDISPEANPDIVGTMQDMPEVESGSMDALYSSHNVEHVYFHEVVGVLQEFKRVLKPEGFCVVTCPDIQLVAQKIVAHGIDYPLYNSPAGPITANDILYGHSDSIKHGDHFMAHKTGFDLKGLAQRFEKAGYPLFKGKRNDSQISLWFIGFKAGMDDDLANQMFQTYTRLSGRPVL
ncbi:MAG: class I SAM-dependent methyltransferase [Kordiimonadaceae bacterium]|nr:class I SAM-dependent methyltransferase [Kordiimonadaceae bacterium]